MAGSNIILGDTLFMKSQQKTFTLATSRDMVPSARILVYGILNGGEVLTDSLSFHVNGIRGNGVRATLFSMCVSRAVAVFVKVLFKFHNH